MAERARRSDRKSRGLVERSSFHVGWTFVAMLKELEKDVMREAAEASGGDRCGLSALDQFLRAATELAGERSPAAPVRAADNLRASVTAFADASSTIEISSAVDARNEAHLLQIRKVAKTCAELVDRLHARAKVAVRLGASLSALPQPPRVLLEIVRMERRWSKQSAFLLASTWEAELPRRKDTPASLSQSRQLAPYQRVAGICEIARRFDFPAHEVLLSAAAGYFPGESFEPALAPRFKVFRRLWPGVKLRSFEAVPIEASVGTPCCIRLMGSNVLVYGEIAMAVPPSLQTAVAVLSKRSPHAISSANLARAMNILSSLPRSRDVVFRKRMSLLRAGVREAFGERLEILHKGDLWSLCARGTR